MASRKISLDKSTKVHYNSNMETTQTNNIIKSHKRISLFDGIRGICIIMMVLHHLIFNIRHFNFLQGTGANRLALSIYNGAALPWLMIFFQSLFIFLTGMSSKLSRNNFRRSGKIAAAALLVTAATTVLFYPDSGIFFGILHFMAAASLIYALIDKYFPIMFRKYWLAPIYFALFVLFHHWTTTIELTFRTINIFGLQFDPVIFGFMPPHFATADFFGIFPWIFMFFVGALFGELIKSGKLNDTLEKIRLPFLDKIGTKTLLIYIIHQPVLFVLLHLADWMR